MPLRTAWTPRLWKQLEDTESEEFDPAAAKTALTAFAGQFSATDTATYVVVDEETMADEEVTATGADLAAALTVYDQYGYAEPDPADSGYVGRGKCMGE